MAHQNKVESVSLYDVARSLRVEPNKLKQSFERFLDVVPEARDNIDAVEEITRGGFGGRCLTYRIDTVALMAFMYWRHAKGRLPRYFGVNSRVIEGGAFMDAKEKKMDEVICLATMADQCFGDHDYLMSRVEACAMDCPEIRSHVDPVTVRIDGKAVPTYILDRVGAYLFFGWAFFEGSGTEGAMA